MTYDPNDMSNIYEEAERYLKSSLGRWKPHLPQLWEDAYQEGMIQVWRDVEAGVTPKLKIMRRAAMSAEKFFHRNGEYFFGKPRKSREGISTNSTTREKVQVFLEEYLPVHDWVYPTSTVVANALGIRPENAAQHLKRIREGRTDHMKYREDGRMDWDYYNTVSVELLGSAGDTDKPSNRSWTDDPRLTYLQSEFEEALIADLNVAHLIKDLSPSHKEILYKVFYEGYTPTEIARGRGVENNPNSIGSKTYNAALSQLRMLLDPYEGECSKGHKRSAETSQVKRRVDGFYLRICTVCRKNGGGDKSLIATKPMGRKVKTHCPKGHLKDQIDSHGRYRCSTCRAEAQRRYTAKKRAQDDSPE